MQVRFLLMDAFSMGGTIRTTLNLAAALTRYHDVEVASVCARRDEPRMPHDPRVRLRRLVDESPAHLNELAVRGGPASWARRQIRERLGAAESRLIHPDDFKHDTFTRLTDLALYRYLKTMRGGAVVGTRAGLNLAVARHGRPSVVRIGSEHLHHDVYRQPIHEAMRRLAPNLDAYTTLTERDAESWRKTLAHRVRVETIPNAVPDTGPEVSALDGKVVVAAGRLSRQKGFDRLVTAWGAVADRHPDWELRIFGAGREQDALCQAVTSAGLTESVRLMGYSDRLYDEMRAASVYVMSSRFEGFPMTLLESMSCGLPPVSFDLTNGPREVIVDGENGILVKNKDVDGLAEGLCELIEDEDKRRTFGKRAAETAGSYDIENIAQRWHDLLTELATGRRHR